MTLLSIVQTFEVNCATCRLAGAAGVGRDRRCSPSESRLPAAHVPDYVLLRTARCAGASCTRGRCNASRTVRLQATGLDAELHSWHDLRAAARAVQRAEGAAHSLSAAPRKVLRHCLLCSSTAHTAYADTKDLYHAHVRLPVAEIVPSAQRCMRAHCRGPWTHCTQCSVGSRLLSFLSMRCRNRRIGNCRRRSMPTSSCHWCGPSVCSATVTSFVSCHAGRMHPPMQFSSIVSCSNFRAACLAPSFAGWQVPG